MPDDKLKELTGRLEVVNTDLDKVIKEAEGELEGVAQRSMSAMKADAERLLKEQESLTTEIEDARTLERAALEAKETRAYLDGLNAPVNRPNLNGPADDGDVKATPFRSLGARYMASDEWAGIRALKEGDGATAVFDIGIREMLVGGAFEEKRATRALFENSDFDPYEEQSMLISGLPWGGPRMFAASIPQIPIATDTAQWYRLTTRTEPTNYNIAEGAVYPEGTFEYTRESSNVIARGWFVPVTDWAEEDSPAAMADIDRNLVMGVARNIDGYCIGVLLGTLTGKQTVAAGSASTTSAIYDAITALRVDGDAEPNMIVMHPNDWANIVTEQASTGEYLFSGMANNQMMMQRWGLPVIPDTAVTEGRVLVLDSNAVRLRDRRAMTVRTADRWRVSSNLTQPTGQMLHFGAARFAFYAVYPQGIADITL